MPDGYEPTDEQVEAEVYRWRQLPGVGYISGASVYIAARDILRERHKGMARAARSAYEQAVSDTCDAITRLMEDGRTIDTDAEKQACERIVRDLEREKTPEPQPEDEDSHYDPDDLWREDADRIIGG